MRLVDALMRWFFGLPPKARLLAAAQINLWVMGCMLVDQASGTLIPLPDFIRREIRQRLESCAVGIKLAIFERAWDIAGVGSGLTYAGKLALARLPDLSARDVSGERLAARMLQLFDLIERFEELAHRHAARLRRHAERRQTTAFASAVPQVAIEGTQCAERLDQPLIALVLPRMCIAAGLRVSVPP